MSVHWHVDTLLHDERIPEFLKVVRRLHGVPVRILGNGGELYAESGVETEDGVNHEAPLTIWGNRVGTVRVRSTEESGEKAEEIARVVAMYAESILDAEYQMGSLAQEITEKYEEVNLLYDLSSELGALFDEEMIGVALLNRLDTILRVGCGSVFVLRDGDYVPLAMKTPGLGACEATGRTFRLPSTEGVLGELTKRRKPILVSDENSLSAETREEEDFLPTDSLLAVPLLRSKDSEEETLLGAIVLTAKEDGKAFTTGDQMLVTAVSSQATTAIHNARMVEELKDAERLKRDLELAREIQTSLLPKDAPSLEGFDIAGRCVTAENVGGDYYGYVVNDGSSAYLLIGDVTGHDLGAALLMSTARATLLGAVADSDNPGILLQRANRILYPDLSSACLLITLFAARVELKTKRLLFANGGHNPPLLLRGSSDTIELLDAEGLILGVEEEVEYEVGMRNLQAGDLVLFYTDGIVEARSPADRILGDEGLKELVLRYRALPAGEFIDALFREAASFTGGSKLKDDITMVVLKVT